MGKHEASEPPSRKGKATSIVGGLALGAASLGGYAALTDTQGIPIVKDQAETATHPAPKAVDGTTSPPASAPSSSPSANATQKIESESHHPTSESHHPAPSRSAQPPAKTAKTPSPAAQVAARPPSLAPSPNPAVALPIIGTTLPTTPLSIIQLISFLRAQVGKPYVFGAEGPNAFDCSGLVQVAMSRIGVSVPRTSQEQSARGTRVSLSELRPGDLLFWGGVGTATHSAVYIGGGQYVAAENPRVGVVLYTISFYSPDFARRVI